jgi:hypothetical protein
MCGKGAGHVDRASLHAPVCGGSRVLTRAGSHSLGGAVRPVDLGGGYRALPGRGVGVDHVLVATQDAEQPGVPAARRMSPAARRRRVWDCPCRGRVGRSNIGRGLHAPTFPRGRPAAVSTCSMKDCSSVARDETVREVAVRRLSRRCSARSRFAEAVKWPCPRSLLPFCGRDDAFVPVATGALVFPVVRARHARGAWSPPRQQRISTLPTEGVV